MGGRKRWPDNARIQSVRCANAGTVGPVSPAHVVGSTLVFTLDDSDRSLRRVILDCDDAIWGPRRFRRTARGWSLTIGLPDLQRLEYRLVITRRDGETVVVLDPDNPERVPTAFGQRSVALLPGYEPPAWTRFVVSRRAWATRDLVVSTRHVGDLPVQIWAPSRVADTSRLPLLVVLDGPEMVRLASLDQYAAAMIGSQALPPFRMMLCQPVHRDEWYSANPDYLAAEVYALNVVSDSYGVAPDQVVVMGASLGGLTALLLALGDGFAFAGALSQSGSFFTANLDPQEASYPWFDQITAAVSALDHAERRPMPLALTCGATEENAANNRAMARRLRLAGHDVRYREVPDLHNYTAWRDTWQPVLTDLLRRCFRPDSATLQERHR
jgi:enterochelin esterase-like enzyme